MTDMSGTYLIPRTSGNATMRLSTLGTDKCVCACAGAGCFKYLIQCVRLCFLAVYALFGELESKNI